MLVANAAANNWASLNHDFSADANTASSPLVIQFDAWVDGGASYAWLGFGIDSSQGTDFYGAAYGQNFAQSAGPATYKFVLSDSTGLGSAFNGVANGAIVKFYKNNVLQSTTTATLASGSGYLTFKEDQWDGYSIGHVDNLSISVSPAYTVTYSGNGNSNGTAPTDGSSPYISGSTVTVTGNTGSLSKTGYNFGGWNTAADGSGTTYAPGNTFNVTSNTVLYAKWVAGYTVTYNANGGINPPVDANGYGSGATVTVLGPGSISRTGYTFTNWNTVANGSGTSYHAGNTFSISSNTTLYAQWNINQYTLTYNAGGGGTVSGTTPQTVNYGGSGSTVTAVPNAGYRFVNWSDSVATASRTDASVAGNITVTANFDNNLVWDNGGGTFAWNTTDTNWTGSVWNNSVSDNANFNGAGAGTVTLQQNITAGSVKLGVTSLGYVLNGNGNTLQVVGDLSEPSDINPSAGLTLSNGVFNLNRVVTSSTGAGDWGLLNIASGASVTVTNGIDGSVGSPNTFALNLNGGTLVTPSIKVADLHQTWGNSFLSFNGTEVIAAGDNADFIQTYGALGNNNSLTVAAGGAILNTAGHSVTINPSLIGTGGLTKKGAGTLTLTASYAANTYAGSTVVQAGVLSIGANNALGGGIVVISNGAAMNLNYSGQIQVSNLTLGGTPVPVSGTYGSTASGAQYPNDTYFTGNGVLYVYIPPANQVLTWTGAVDNNWDEATADWTNIVPYTQWFNNSIAPNSAIFDTTGLGQPNVNVAFSDTFYASNLTVNAAGYTISGNALTLGNTPTLTVNSNLTIGNVLTGSGGLTKTGNATLTLTGVNNTYTGNTTVSAGTLEIGGSGNYLATQTGGAVTVSNSATILISSAGNNALPFQNSTPAWTVAGTVNVTGGGANTIPAAGVVLNNGTLTGTPANTQYGTFLSIQAANVPITANGSANTISSDNFAVSQTLTLNTPLTGDALAASSGFFDGLSGAGSLAKSGLGTATLSGASTFTGGVAVNAGTLFVNGSVTSGATVGGGTLAGSGTIGGAVIVNAGGTIAAGAALNGIGTLTLSSQLNLSGNVLVNLKKGQAQSNSVFIVSGVLTNANGTATTLTVNNLGSSLAVGDKFQVFSETCSNGAAVTIIPPAGVTFNNNLAVDGSISVATVGSPTLSYVKSGTGLTFTWTGSGSLEWQTNALTKGLSTNWVDYPNGTNGVTVTIDPTKGSVFFRVKQ